MSSSPSDGAVRFCPGCGAGVPDPSLRFCVGCGRDLAPVMPGPAEPQGTPSQPYVPQPYLPQPARAARSGGKGSLILAIVGVASVVIGALGLFLPLISIGYGTKISFLQGRDLCANPFGAMSSDCSMLTLGFFASILVLALGLIFITVGLIRWGGRGSSTPEHPRMAPFDPANPPASAPWAQAPTQAASPAMPGTPAQPSGWNVSDPATPAAWPAATPAAPVDWGAKAAPAMAASRRVVGRAVTVTVSASGRAARRFRALDPKIRLGIAIVPVVIVAAAFAITTLNSPENQIKQITEGLAARQAPSRLLEAGAFAESIGIARAPSGIAFAVADVKVTPDKLSGSYDATWTLTATGNGKSTAATISATFHKVKDTYAGTWVSGAVEVTSLVAQVDSDDAVQALIDSTNAANAALGSAASSITETVEDAAAPIPDPVQVADDTLLAGPPVPVAGKEGVPAQLRNTYLTVGGGQYLVRTVSIPAVPATVVVGTLQPATFTGPAAESLRALAAAREAGDVVEASRHLVNADGLTASGLAASSVTSVPEAQLTVDGSPGGYFVALPGGTKMTPGPDGTWQLDYTGQPLQELSFAQELHYTAPDEAGSDIRVHVKPVSVLAGQEQAGLALTLDVDHAGGDRWYANDYVSIAKLSLNGEPVAEMPSFSCPVKGYGPETLTCEMSGLPVPSGGLKSIGLTITLGSTWGGLDQYGRVPFSSAP